VPLTQAPARSQGRPLPASNIRHPPQLSRCRIPDLNQQLGVCKWAGKAHSARLTPRAASKNASKFSDCGTLGERPMIFGVPGIFNAAYNEEVEPASPPRDSR
jgi:hypothetical protein